MNVSIGQVTLISVFFCLSCSQKISTPPHIVLILADDLGYGSIGCYGNDTIATPHLDALAEDGLLFTNFYANGPVCTPTRAALLTGRYQQRAGLEGVIYARGQTRQTGLDTAEVTLADMLRRSGYTSAIVGKWHLGYAPAYNPLHQGFSDFHGYVSGNVDYQTHVDGAGIYDWWDGRDTAVEVGYVTDLITDHATRFIQNHQRDPFFLYIAHESPHVPFQGPGDDGYRQVDSTFSYLGPVKDQGRALREMIESLDLSVGKVVSALEEQGLRESTLLIFISDNGGERWADNGDLKGHKTMLTEGGIRVPAIFSWPGTIPPGRSDQPAITMDIVPTVLDLCAPQVQAPPLDGISLRPILTEGSFLPDRPLYWRYRDSRAVRRGNWKLHLESIDTTLFDLSQDAQERHNLRAQEQAVANDLLEGFRAWDNEMNGYAQKTK